MATMSAEDIPSDPRFLSRVYLTAIIAWSIGSALLVMAGAKAVVGFAAAGALSLLLLAAQERMVKPFFSPGGSIYVGKFVWLSLVKYICAFTAIGLLIRFRLINPLAFCIGILLVPGAICLQAAMMWLGAPGASDVRKN